MAKIDVKGVIKFLIPLAFTVALVWYMFRKVNFREVMDIIAAGCDFWWIMLSMFLSIFSHVARAARWRIQLRHLGVNPPFMQLCCSVFGCYAINLIFPRGGELWRCTYIGARKDASFTTVFGSMLAERVIDTLTVCCLLLLTIITAHGAIDSFLETYPIGRDFISLALNPLVWAAAVVVAFIGYATVRMFGNTRPVRKITEWISQIWKGFAGIAAMPNRGLFLLLSLTIWVCYFVQFYVAFFAFDFTTALCREPGLGYGLEPALVAFVISAIGMAVPSNGGLGPWNICVMFGLAIYGISDANGYAFSIVQWTGQTVMLILLGIYTMIYINRHPVNASVKNTYEKTLKKTLENT